jgi:hypothetical protein
MRRSTISIAATLVFGWGIAACDGGQQQQPAPQGSESGEDDDEGGDDDPIDLTSDDGAVFDLWCKKAGETEITGKQMEKYFQKFCENGEARSLLNKSLLSIAYSGSGDPELKKLAKYEHDDDAQTTTAYFAVAMKLPISIKTHFNKVGPKGGDKSSLIDLAEEQGASAEVDILKTYKNDGKYHVRGWKVKSRNEKKVSGISIVTDTVARSDQFELSDGKAYMYTQYLEEGIEGVENFDMLTAGVQVGNNGVLITQVYVTADNKGQTALAESQIKNTAEDTIKAMYEAAEKFKGQDDGGSSGGGSSSGDDDEDAGDDEQDSGDED